MISTDPSAAVANDMKIRQPIGGFTRELGRRTNRERPVMTQAPDQATNVARKKKSKMPLLIIGVITLTFTGVYAVAKFKKEQSAAARAPKVAALSDLDSLMPGKATPATLPVGGQRATSVKPLTPPDPPVLHSEYAQVQLNVAQIQGSIDALKESQSAMNTDVATLREEQQKLARLMASKQVAIARAKSKVVPRLKAVSPPIPPVSASILSIDSWDGRPSVSVSQGNQIKFLNEGDAIGGHVLKSADGRKQQAEFMTPDGQARRVRVRENAQ